MQKFSYNANVHCTKFSGKCLVLGNEILKRFGKGLKIITVALIWGCESNRLYNGAIPDTQ